MIEQKLVSYPQCEVGDDVAEYSEIIRWLEGFCVAFDWDKTEKEFVGKKDEYGKHSRFKSLATLIRKWINGNDINYITKSSIDYYEKHINRADLLIEGQLIPYNRSKFHKNIVTANTLDDIENDIMFTLNNYCIKYSKEYKDIYTNDISFDDCRLYIQAGSHDPRTISLQMAGLSRDTSLYLRNSDYIKITDAPSGKMRLRIKNSIFECKKESVLDEIELLRNNTPELFED